VTTILDVLADLRDNLAAAIEIFGDPAERAKMVRVKPAGDCACRWAKAPYSDPELHDRLVSMESLSPVQAADLATIIISDHDPHTRAERKLIGDPAEFPQIVMAHNWRDPVAMESLVNYVTEAMEQAFHGRHSARPT
jgi:hypothetical protein